MANIYVRMIQSGLMTLDQVPALWREEVRKQLEDRGE